MFCNKVWQGFGIKEPGYKIRGIALNASLDTHQICQLSCNRRNRDQLCVCKRGKFYFRINWSFILRSSVLISCRRIPVKAFFRSPIQSSPFRVPCMLSLLPTGVKLLPFSPFKLLSLFSLVVPRPPLSLSKGFSVFDTPLMDFLSALSSPVCVASFISS